MTQLKIGDKAPDFTLYDSDKKEVKLSSFLGSNVVILFFPLAFTSTCTTELCSVRDDISAYQNLNATVLAISIDTPHTLARYKEEQKLNMPLLSDFNKEVSAAYGSQYAEFVLGMRGVAKRSAFVIDKDGIIRYEEVLENAGQIPDLEAVKTTLSRLT
ncbi:MAG TPA: peroxiredoxin [Bacteroidetes bacterium]|nr:peroxiredoxin [Bacteroidota bacterium]